MTSVAFLLLQTVAWGEETRSEAFRPRPIAGHPVFDFRVGVDRLDARHPQLCAELTPLAWVSVEACGTGAGFLHQDPNARDMAHFRARFRAAKAQMGRFTTDLLLGAGFAEIQTTADQPGFLFGNARSEDQVEAAGPEASASLKGRFWVDRGGRTYLTADLNAGAAVIPAAPTVIGRGGPIVPFAALTVGYGF